MKSRVVDETIGLGMFILYTSLFCGYPSSSNLMLPALSHKSNMLINKPPGAALSAQIARTNI